MSLKNKFVRFCNDNIVLIVCIPLLIGVHWTWTKVQENPLLVPPKDKKELPLFAVRINLNDFEKNSICLYF